MKTEPTGHRVTSRLYRTQVTEMTEVIATDASKDDSERAEVFTTDTGNGTFGSAFGGALRRRLERIA